MDGKRKPRRRPPTGRQGQPYLLRDAARILRLDLDELRALANSGAVPVEYTTRGRVITGDTLLALMAQRPEVAA